MDISVDFDTLAGARDQIQRLVTELKNTEEFSSGVASTVGHDRLGDTVQDFASSWNTRRRDLLEQMGMVGDFITAVHDMLRELDQRLAKGVEPVSATDLSRADLNSYFDRRTGS